MFHKGTPEHRSKSPAYKRQSLPKLVEAKTPTIENVDKIFQASEKINDELKKACATEIQHLESLDQRVHAGMLMAHLKVINLAHDQDRRPFTIVAKEEIDEKKITANSLTLIIEEINSLNRIQRSVARSTPEGVKVKPRKDREEEAERLHKEQERKAADKSDKVDKESKEDKEFKERKEQKQENTKIIVEAARSKRQPYSKFAKDVADRISREEVAKITATLSLKATSKIARRLHDYTATIAEFVDKIYKNDKNDITFQRELNPQNEAAHKKREDQLSANTKRRDKFTTAGEKIIYDLENHSGKINANTLQLTQDYCQYEYANPPGKSSPFLIILLAYIQAIVDPSVLIAQYLDAKLLLEPHTGIPLPFIDPRTDYYHYLLDYQPQIIAAAIKQVTISAEYQEIKETTEKETEDKQIAYIVNQLPLLHLPDTKKQGTLISLIRKFIQSPSDSFFSKNPIHNEFTVGYICHAERYAGTLENPLQLNSKNTNTHTGSMLSPSAKRETHSHSCSSPRSPSAFITLTSDKEGFNKGYERGLSQKDSLTPSMLEKGERLDVDYEGAFKAGYAAALNGNTKEQGYKEFLQTKKNMTDFYKLHRKQDEKTVNGTQVKFLRARSKSTIALTSSSLNLPSVSLTGGLQTSQVDEIGSKTKTKTLRQHGSHQVTMFTQAPALGVIPGSVPDDSATVDTPAQAQVTAKKSI